MIVTLLFALCAIVTLDVALTVALLVYLVGQLRFLANQVQRIITMDQKTLDLLKKIDDETTAVGAEVADLKGKIGTGMSDADVTELQGRLGAISDRLTGIAADPANPVPAPVA